MFHESMNKKTIQYSFARRERILTSKPMIESGDLVISCRMTTFTIPTKLTPGIKVVGEVLFITLDASLVRPTLICTEFLGVLSTESAGMPSLVKLTVTSRSGNLSLEMQLTWHSVELYRMVPNDYTVSVRWVVKTLQCSLPL